MLCVLKKGTIMTRIKLIIDGEIKAILSSDDILHVIPYKSDRSDEGNINVFRQSDNENPLRISGTRDEVDEMMCILDKKLKSSSS